MGSKIHSHKVLLAVQPLKSRPFLGIRDGRLGYLNGIESAEERVCGFLLNCLILVSVSYKAVYKEFALAVWRKELLALNAERVERSGVCKVFDSLAVTCREIYALNHVEDVFESTVLLALQDDGKSGTLAHSLNGSHSETDVSLVVYGKLNARLVHIRSERLYTHALALVHQFGNIGYAVQTSAHNGCHILRRIVRLEVSRLIGNPRVARCVTLVEGV